VRVLPAGQTTVVTRFWCSASHEQFPPDDLLLQAREAEAAGFDGIGSSDHFQPWWPEGQSGQAWVWLGAALQATARVPAGTGVTPVVHHYHPALVAQAFMTLEVMFPGRTFLGVGSGEALNEVPLGADWPSPGEQVQRLDDGLDVIRRLWDGEVVTADAGWFRCREAKLFTRAEGRRPALYVSAFGPKAARVAARHGDGLWTLADPEQAPGLIDTYKGACEDLGREPGEIVLHTGIAWARDDEALMEGVRPWRGTQPPQLYTDDIHDTREVAEVGRREVSDEELREGLVVSTDPAEHAERLREIERLGATVVCCQVMGGADPHGTIRTYGEHVLPSLRG
jgi:coenzyme F420-dependent glucose-6-phosphate dehydrogenase